MSVNRGSNCERSLWSWLVIRSKFIRSAVIDIGVSNPMGLSLVPRLLSNLRNGIGHAIEGQFEENRSSSSYIEGKGLRVFLSSV